MRLKIREDYNILPAVYCSSEKNSHQHTHDITISNNSCSNPPTGRYLTIPNMKMTESISSFEVPLILNDLRKEETIVNIISSISQLTKVSDHIFSTIDQKCDQFQSTLQGLTEVRTFYNSPIMFFTKIVLSLRSLVFAEN